MTPAELETVLDRAEADLSAGRSPDMGDFWKAVAAVKRDRALADRYAGRIGAVELAAFRRWAPVTVPMWVGVALMGSATVVGLGLLVAGFVVEEPWNGLAFIAATGVLVASVHGLTHLVVGRAVGIRFVAWFASLRRPQPGIKTDYASYLATPPRSRAWMHASGAIATKAVPFLVLPAAALAGAPWWALVAILALGIAQLVTDAVWSVKSSDWSRFRREMAIAREQEGKV